MIFWQLKKKRASHNNAYGENPFLNFILLIKRNEVKEFVHY